MKVAFIYGCNPLLTILAGSAFGRLVSEYDVYGGTRGRAAGTGSMRDQ